VIALRTGILFLLLSLTGCATVQPPAPGVEIAVAFDQDGERGASATGLADPAIGRAATPDDPARIASVSKLVVAIGVMRLVDQGRLDLDADVSNILGWRLRNPAFPDQPITLAQLMSHTASVRDHDDQYAIPLGGSLKAVMAEANSWDAAHAPASKHFTYANLNFPIVASIVERVTGERFDVWMRRDLFDPMAIDACFNWPTCSDASVARAIVLTQQGKAVRDDLIGQRPACPVVAAHDGSCDLSRWRPGDNGALFAPQGGLRISARGLARIGRMLLGHGMIDGRRILSRESVEALLAPRWTFDGGNGDSEQGLWCRYGLATQQLATPRGGCRDDPGLPKGQWVGHLGEAYGLRSGLWIDRASGAGIAYLVTGLDAVPPKGRSAFSAAEERVVARAVAIGQQRP
jgi:CubicO group peptidase (beta-lactamase class C family)